MTDFRRTRAKPSAPNILISQLSLKADSPRRRTVIGALSDKSRCDYKEADVPRVDPPIRIPLKEKFKRTSVPLLRIHEPPKHTGSTSNNNMARVPVRCVTIAESSAIAPNYSLNSDTTTNALLNSDAYSDAFIDPQNQENSAVIHPRSLKSESFPYSESYESGPLVSTPSAVSGTGTNPQSPGSGSIRLFPLNSPTSSSCSSSPTGRHTRVSATKAHLHL